MTGGRYVCTRIHDLLSRIGSVFVCHAALTIATMMGMWGGHVGRWVGREWNLGVLRIRRTVDDNACINFSQKGSVTARAQ
jgi:hypothetical protein